MKWKNCQTRGGKAPENEESIPYQSNCNTLLPLVGILETQHIQGCDSMLILSTSFSSQNKQSITNLLIALYKNTSISLVVAKKGIILCLCTFNVDDWHVPTGSAHLFL